MRSPRATPSLRRHKPSSLGVVTLNCKDHYLGHCPESRKHPPEDAQAAYDRLIAEWLASGRRLDLAPDKQPEGISINELALAYWKHAEAYYGLTKQRGDYHNLRHA